MLSAEHKKASVQKETPGWEVSSKRKPPRGNSPTVFKKGSRNRVRITSKEPVQIHHLILGHRPCAPEEQITNKLEADRQTKKKNKGGSKKFINLHEESQRVGWRNSGRCVADDQFNVTEESKILETQSAKHLVLRNRTIQNQYFKLVGSENHNVFAHFPKKRNFKVCKMDQNYK